MDGWINSYSKNTGPWMICSYYACEYFSMMAVEYQVNRLTQGLAINSINQLPAEIMMKRDEYDG
jgi:hypothetical protein